MNFVTSVFKKYINKQNDVKSTQGGDNAESTSAQWTNKTAKAIESQEKTTFKSSESHSENKNTAFLNDEEETFQDAETNITSNNFFLTEATVTSPPHSSEMQAKDRESGFVLPDPSFAQIANDNLKNGNPNAKNSLIFTTEPDSLNNSMVDSLELANTTNTAREMIDSIEILQDSKRYLSEPIIDNLETEEYKSLEPLPTDFTQNIINVEKLESPEKPVSLSDILFDVPKKNLTILDKTDYKTHVSNNSETGNQSTGALETLIQNVNQTLVINSQANKIQLPSTPNELSSKKNQEESSLNERDTEESEISDSKPNALNIENIGEQIVTFETKNTDNQEKNINEYVQELKIDLEQISNKSNQLLDNSELENNNTEQNNQNADKAQSNEIKLNKDSQDEAENTTNILVDKTSKCHENSDELILEQCNTVEEPNALGISNPCTNGKLKPYDTTMQNVEKDTSGALVKIQQNQLIKEAIKEIEKKESEIIFDRQEPCKQYPENKEGSTENLIEEDIINNSEMDIMREINYNAEKSVEINDKGITDQTDNVLVEKVTENIAAKSITVDKDECTLNQKTNTNNAVKEANDKKMLEKQEKLELPCNKNVQLSSSQSTENLPIIENKMQYNKSYSRQDTFEMLEKQCAESTEFNTECTGLFDKKIVFNRQDTKEFELMEKQCAENANNVENSISFDRQETGEFENLEKQCQDDVKNQKKITDDILEALVAQTTEHIKNIKPIPNACNSKGDIEIELNRNSVSFQSQETQEFESLEKKLQSTAENQKIVSDILEILVSQSTELKENIGSQEFKVNEERIVKANNKENEHNIIGVNDDNLTNKILFNRQDTQEFENLEKECQDAVGKLIINTTKINEEKKDEEKEISKENLKINTGATENQQSMTDNNFVTFNKEVNKENESNKEIYKNEHLQIFDQSNNALTTNPTKQNLTKKSNITKSKEVKVLPTESSESKEIKQISAKDRILTTFVQCNAHLQAIQTLEDKSYKNGTDGNMHDLHVNEYVKKLIKSEDSLKLNPQEDDTQKIESGTQLFIKNNNLRTAKNTKNDTISLAQKIHTKEPSKHKEDSEELKDKVDLIQQELDSVRKLNRRKKQYISTGSAIEQEKNDSVSKYKNILKGYEEKIAQQNKDLSKLRMEMEQNVRNFTNTEMAFSDVFEKYEKAKFVIGAYGRNEDILLENIKNAEEQLSRIENKCLLMKQQSMEQIKQAHEQIEQEKRKYKHEISKLQAQVKRLEIKASSLEVAVQQKIDECQALAALCDDITGRN